MDYSAPQAPPRATPAATATARGEGAASPFMDPPHESPPDGRSVRMDRRSKDTWTMVKIMAEFVEGFETLRPVWPAVTVRCQVRRHL